MKIKNAIGISINGNNVKAAFLSIIKGKVYIQGLQSTTLRAPLESSLPTDDKGEQNIENDLEKAFDIQQQPDDDVDTSSDLAIKPTKYSNVSVIYSLLDKFKNMTTKVRINAPVLTVKYDMVDADAVPKDKKGESSEQAF